MSTSERLRDPVTDEPPLNPFARRLDEAFSSAFPEWRAHAYPYQKWCGPGDPLDERDFFVPNPLGYGGLDVLTWKGSVRVTFEWFQRTWRADRRTTEQAAIAQAVQFVRDLAGESLVIVYRKGPLHWLDKDLFRVVAVPVRDGRFAEGRGFLASRSWRGTWSRGEPPRIRM